MQCSTGWRRRRGLGGILNQNWNLKKQNCAKGGLLYVHQHWINRVTLRRFFTIFVGFLLLKQNTWDNKPSERIDLFGFMVLEVCNLVLVILALEPATRQFIMVRSAWWEMLFTSSPETKEKKRKEGANSQLAQTLLTTHPRWPTISSYIPPL